MNRLFHALFCLLLSIPAASAQTWAELNAKAVSAYNSDDSKAAIEWGKQALAKAETEFGTSHANYATSVGNLAVFYKGIGDYAHAEPMLKQALELDRKILGPEHADVAVDLGNLARIYVITGRYDLAEPLYKQAVEIRRKALGVQSPVLAGSLHTLASLYSDMGRYALAESLYKEALEIRRKVLGEENAHVAATINNLALLYYTTGRYAEAEPLYKQAIEIDRKVIGEDNASFAIDLNNLAELYRVTGRYAQAEPLYKQAIDIKRKKNGEQNNDFAISLNNLALLYKEMGNYAAAEPLYRQAMEIDRQVLGEQHPGFATDLTNTAGLYIAMGNYVQAEPLYKQALEIRRKVLGEEHTLFAASINNLATLYHAVGNYAQAIPLAKQALEIRRRTLGEQHPEFAASLNNLAEMYFAQGNYAAAEPLYKQAVEIDRRALGEEHPGFAGDLNNLAGFYSAMGNYQAAEILYKQALEIERKALGEGHPAYANGLNNLGMLYDNQGKYAQAELLYKQALEIRRKTLGELHADFAVSLNNLAGLYNVQHRYAEAEPLYKQSLEIRKQTFGPEHPAVATALNNLALLYYAMGNYPQAEPLYLQSLAIKQKKLGEQHPDFASGIGNLGSLYLRAGNIAKAAVLYDSCNSLLLNSISRNYAFLSEEEKEKYNRTILDMFESYSGFTYQHRTQLPLTVTRSFNNILATSSLLLKSNIAMQHAISASADTGAKRKYAEWIELRKAIARAYGLGIAEREKRGLDVPSLEARAQAIEKELVKISAVFAGSNGQTDYNQVRKALDKNEAAIEFSSFQYFNGRRWTDSVLYCAYIVRKTDSAPVYVALFEEKELQPLLAGTYHSDRGLAIDGKNADVTTDPGAALYGLIWQKLEQYLQGITTVYITPAGLLNKVSFEGIKDKTGSYLLNRYQLYHMLSSAEIAHRETARKVPVAKSIALIGGARFDPDPGATQLAGPAKVTGGETLAMNSSLRAGNALSPWSYLSGTLDEVLAIKSTLAVKQWHCSLDTGTAATEERLLALAGAHAPEVLHIATHGFYLPPPRKEDRNKTAGTNNVFRAASNPLLRSGIILSGANNKWVNDRDIPGVENGIVTAMDIANLDFSGTGIIVLSACETGLGDIQSGEGVYGLQRAFRLAGAEKMIISLWQVPDKETAEMMTLFYSNIAAGGVSYHDAFIAAQRAMQQKYPAGPLKWAAFELVGE